MAHMAAQRDSLSWNFTCQASDSRVSPAGAFTAGSGQKQDDLYKTKKGISRTIQKKLFVLSLTMRQNVTMGML